MKAEELITAAEQELVQQFEEADRMEQLRTKQILDIFRKYEVSARHFNPTTGYGYDDVGRDTLEKIFADLFETEEAIVRPQIASGTHALSLCLFGLTLPGDRIVSATGLPYDTLHTIIGIGETTPPGSLKEMGISFDSVPLSDIGEIDVDAVDRAIDDRTTLVIAQRSRGYDWRASLTPDRFEKLANMIHQKHPGVTLMMTTGWMQKLQRVSLQRQRDTRNSLL